MTLKRWLFITLAALLASVSCSAWSFPDQYDKEIKKAAQQYLPGVNWRLLKAQLYQESRLDPQAESPAGAEGIAQFMPATWKEVSRKIGRREAAPQAVEPAVLASAYYMATLRRSWYSRRSDVDRHSLAMASYNAGLGNLVKAQRLSGMRVRYKEIVEYLPRVTGRHSEETVTYVERIWQYYAAMAFE